MLNKRADLRPTTASLICGDYFLDAMAHPTWQAGALGHHIPSNASTFEL